MLISILRQALAIQTLEYENKNHLSGDTASRSLQKMRLLREALDIVESGQVTVQCTGHVQDAAAYAIAPGEIIAFPARLGKTASLLPAKLERLRDENEKLQQERNAAQDLAKSLAFDALCAISGAGICTPEHGYLKEPALLRGDIQRLAQERDELREKLAEFIAEKNASPSITGTAYHVNSQGEKDELVMVWIDGESFSKVERKTKGA